MNYISWNISYSSKKEKIAEKLLSEINNQKTIICLMEVMPATYEYLKSQLSENYGMSYSLDFRHPGKFDSRSRKLGVMFVYPKRIEVSKVDVLWRAPFPDRTLMMQYKEPSGNYKTIMTLHSITGCGYKKTKSVQFNTFAEIVDDIKPDVVTFDANEPKEDAFDIEDMVFFDNMDKGAAARRFFISLIENDLADSFTLTHNREDFMGKQPLAISHVIRRKTNKRYDFLFVRKDSPIKSCEYCYDEGIEATSDHAIIKVRF